MRLPLTQLTKAVLTIIRRQKCHIKFSMLIHAAEGKLEKNNEDNFWVLGNYLERLNGGMATIVEGQVSQKTVPAFGVFDGMGGESCGETAAFFSGRATFQQCYQEDEGECQDYVEEFLRNSCISMNNEVCRYAWERRVDCMGATAALLVFGRTRIGVCNGGGQPSIPGV